MRPQKEGVCLIGCLPQTEQMTLIATGECGVFAAQPAMKSAKSYSLVLVTAPELKTARRLASAALNRRLIACANLIPKLESHYWWKGKIERGSEVLMLLKTANSQLASLEQFILKEHPYDTPEFLVTPLNKGSKAYLEWLTNSVHPDF